jgi:hypothetical protein
VSDVRLVYAERLDRATPFAWLHGQVLDQSDQHLVHRNLAELRRGRHRSVNNEFYRAVRVEDTLMVNTYCGITDTDGRRQTFVTVIDGVDSDRPWAEEAAHRIAEITAGSHVMVDPLALGDVLNRADHAAHGRGRLLRARRLLSRVTGRARTRSSSLPAPRRQT